MAGSTCPVEVIKETIDKLHMPQLIVSADMWYFAKLVLFCLRRWVRTWVFYPGCSPSIIGQNFERFTHCSFAVAVTLSFSPKRNRLRQNTPKQSSLCAHIIICLSLVWFLRNYVGMLLWVFIPQICYGTTENSPLSFQGNMDDPLEIKSTTIGQPVPHVEVGRTSSGSNTVKSPSCPWPSPEQSVGSCFPRTMRST